MPVKLFFTRLNLKKPKNADICFGSETKSVTSLKDKSTLDLSPIHMVFSHLSYFDFLK